MTELHIQFRYISKVSPFYRIFNNLHILVEWCAIDTGHISLYGAIQSLKHSPLPDEDFDTTTDHFNAV